MTLTWNALQKTYSSDPTEHLAAAQALGLECPIDVFEQLFIDHHGDTEFGHVCGARQNQAGYAWQNESRRVT